MYNVLLKIIFWSEGILQVTNELCTNDFRIIWDLIPQVTILLGPAPMPFEANEN